MPHLVVREHRRVPGGDGRVDVRGRPDRSGEDRPAIGATPNFCSRSACTPRGADERSSSHATRVCPCASRKSGWVTSSPVSATPTSTPVPSRPCAIALVGEDERRRRVEQRVKGRRDLDGQIGVRVGKGDQGGGRAGEAREARNDLREADVARPHAGGKDDSRADVARRGAGDGERAGRVRAQQPHERGAVRHGPVRARRLRLRLRRGRPDDGHRQARQRPETEIHTKAVSGNSPPTALEPKSARRVPMNNKILPAFLFNLVRERHRCRLVVQSAPRFEVAREVYEVSFRLAERCASSAGAGAGARSVRSGRGSLRAGDCRGPPRR